MTALGGPPLTRPLIKVYPFLSLGVCSCQRATDLALLASLRRRAIAASFAPLAIHEYAFGGESCAAGLVCVRLLVVPRQIGRAWHLWRCSSRRTFVLAAAARSRSRSSAGLLPAASSPNRGVWLCRRIRLRASLALRGEAAEPNPRRSLSSTLAVASRSSPRSAPAACCCPAPRYPRQQRKKASSTREHRCRERSRTLTRTRNRAHENVHYTYENAPHPLSIGARCVLAVEKWANPGHFRAELNLPFSPLPKK